MLILSRAARKMPTHGPAKQHEKLQSCGVLFLFAGITLSVKRCLAFADRYIDKFSMVLLVKWLPYSYY